MKVFRGEKFKEYPHTLQDFLRVFNRESMKVTADAGHADFNWLVKKIATELKMTQRDVIRAISVFLRKSMTFRIWTWKFVSFTGKGSLKMKKVTGWSPMEPFDFITSRTKFSDVQIEKMVQEVIS
jgi:hypothetical protein